MFGRKPAPASAVPDDGDQPSRARATLGKKVAGKLSRNPMILRTGDERLTLYMRDRFASPEECAQLRAIIDAGAQPSVLFSGSANADYRTSDSCHMDPQHPPVAAMTQRIAALMGMDRDFGETIQGQRYREGQEYKFHCDYFPTNVSYWPAMREQGGQRCWTAMIYLNEVTEGGETTFPHAGLSMEPDEGRLLIWSNLRKDGSPNPDTLHAAQPVRQGTKYVLTQWFRERPWTPSGI